MQKNRSLFLFHGLQGEMDFPCVCSIVKVLITIDLKEQKLTLNTCKILLQGVTFQGEVSFMFCFFFFSE